MSKILETCDANPRGINVQQIVVGTEHDKEQVLLALEYLHNLREINTDLAAVNSLVHMTRVPDRIVVSGLVGVLPRFEATQYLRLKDHITDKCRERAVKVRGSVAYKEVTKSIARLYAKQDERITIYFFKLMEYLWYNKLSPNLATLQELGLMDNRVMNEVLTKNMDKLQALWVKYLKSKEVPPQENSSQLEELLNEQRLRLTTLAMQLRELESLEGYINTDIDNFIESFNGEEERIGKLLKTIARIAFDNLVTMAGNPYVPGIKFLTGLGFVIASGGNVGYIETKVGRVTYYKR